MARPTPRRRVFSIASVDDVVLARRYGLQAALDLGFHLAEATKIGVAISELARNIEQHAGQGTITITTHGGRDGHIEVVAEDHGPGIEDIDRALAGGYSSSGGMGLGLRGAKRVMDEFEIESTVGVGTRIRAVKWLRPRK